MRQHMKVRWVVVAGIHHKLGMGQTYQGWHFASLMQWLHCFTCALHPKPRASPPSAWATRASPKRRKAQGAVGGSFNSREFFHGKSEAFVSRMRWTAALLGFMPPCFTVGWALRAAGPSTTALTSLWLLQLLGLLAERWCFFAEARQPQNLHCQSVA